MFMKKHLLAERQMPHARRHGISENFEEKPELDYCDYSFCREKVRLTENNLREFRRIKRDPLDEKVFF